MGAQILDAFFYLREIVVPIGLVFDNEESVIPLAVEFREHLVNTEVSLAERHAPPAFRAQILEVDRANLAF